MIYFSLKEVVKDAPSDNDVTEVASLAQVSIDHFFANLSFQKVYPMLLLCSLI